MFAEASSKHRMSSILAAAQRGLATTTAAKAEWRVFVDLQCAYGEKCFKETLPLLRGEFGDRFDFTLSVTSLPYHDNAFAAHVALKVVEDLKGSEAREAFVRVLYDNRDLYTNAATEETSTMAKRKLFADFAVDNGFFDHPGMFVGYLKDFPGATEQAWLEQKESLALAVTDSPAHLIKGTTLLQGPDPYAAWTLADWSRFLDGLK
mmetsp:Transcript_12125/g.36558  ORF Transcript_12125/g.36558 Transcript_12125/m.36558 type:complete len:206 (+) Transcript_12125:3-620(+)